MRGSLIKTKYLKRGNSVFSQTTSLSAILCGRITVLLVFSFLFLLPTIGVKSQTLFFEDFGQHTTRVKCQYTPTNADCYTFADPNTQDNPLTTTGNYSGNEHILANEIENGYYAVIAPANIYTTYASGYTPQYQLWENALISDHTGNTNGAAIVVNAGILLRAFYKRQVALTAGGYYRVSFWYYVVNHDVDFEVRIYDSRGNTILGSVNTNLFTANSTGWEQYTCDFLLPSTCTSGNYYVALRNKYQSDNGNDFYVDDILFQSLSTSSSYTTLSCPPTVVPIANDDQSLNNTPGSTVTVDILSNDKLSDGTTTATMSNATFRVNVPANSTITPYTTYQNFVVPGEGEWRYDVTNSWDASYYGKLVFVPASGFTGNPTPVTYAITGNSTGTTSSPATVTITYTGTPTATADAATMSPGSTATISILNNDKLSDGTTTATASAVSVTLVDNYGIYHTGTNPSFTVSGEGTWAYNSSTGALIFTPVAGFISSPTPISYFITQTSNGNSSSKVTVTIIEQSAALNVSGTVFNDPDGGNVNNSSGTANAVPSGIYANLINNATGLVAASVSVATDGTYNFSAVAPGTYYVILTKAQSTVGSTVPAPSLPTFWMNTGEFIGAENTGTDGTVDGKSTTFTISSADRNNVNFGIMELCGSSGTIFSLNNNGDIKAFTNPAASGSLGPLINRTSYGTTTNANAMGYNPVNGKFYYFQVAEGAESVKKFVSYDPSTNTYETLSTAGAGGSYAIYRGTVTNDGSGYYALTGYSGELLYYNIASNTWTTVVNSISTYKDQYGNSLQTLLQNNTGGDLAIDGNGNMWILAGTSSPTCYVFKLQGHLPTTAVTGSLTLTQIASQSIGTNPSGIAFNISGELYISNSATLFKLNNDYTMKTIGAIPSGAGGDLAGCATPVKPIVADFGDAPDTYKTLLASDGPRHLPAQFNAATDTSTLMLGSKIDIETDGFPSTNADGDDLNNINDEEGVQVFPPLYTASASYTLTVKITNTTGVSATVKGWIDFNRNGVFDASESATATVASGATTATLTWTGLSGLTTGTMYSRIRIATNATEIANPTGLANDGEVEDYYKINVTIYPSIISNGFLQPNMK